MQPDFWSLYTLMLKSRLFEEAVMSLWEQGRISGEMHLGTGEEAIVAGVTDHLEAGDAMALDHRGTSAMLMRGVDPSSLLHEFLGRPQGLCHGNGGHMHLFAPSQLAASSGIVGASGPAAVGFALAAVHLRPGKVAVAFFGDGAMNQGQLLEAMNLAAAWKLPVLFVCKDNQWAITTRSSQVTGGSPAERARAFGMPAVEVDGCAVGEVWHPAGNALARCRQGKGPSFIQARCIHLEGHFLGDQLIRTARHPMAETKKIIGPLLRSAFQHKGAAIKTRFDGLLRINTLTKQIKDQINPADDPVHRIRQLLVREPQRLEQVEAGVALEIKQLLAAALGSKELVQ